jgi:hypothetical protein
VTVVETKIAPGVTVSRCGTAVVAMAFIGCTDIGIPETTAMIAEP